MPETGFIEQDAKQHMIMQNIARAMCHAMFNENSKDDPVEFSNAVVPKSQGRPTKSS